MSRRSQHFVNCEACRVKAEKPLNHVSNMYALERLPSEKWREKDSYDFSTATIKV
jgi:hypothetical protein